MVCENDLDHLCSKFWIPDPLELSERSKLWQCRTEYAWFERQRRVPTQSRAQLTSYKIERISFLIRPVQPQLLDLPGEGRIFLDPIKEIEGSIPVLLIFSEVKVDGGENASLGDPSVERRNKQPRSEVISGDVCGDSVPYLQRSPMTGRLFRGARLRENG